MNIYNETMSIIDLLFPKFCLNCNFPGSYICLKCQSKLVYYKVNRCFLCKKTTKDNLTHKTCLKKLNITQISFIFVYNRLIQKIIKTIKYRLVRDILTEIKLFINPDVIERLSYLKNLSGKVYFQPIPLSKNKYKERGFNQALLITNIFKYYLKFPIANFLTKIKETKNQADLNSKKQRLVNLKGSFKYKGNRNEVKDTKIILVDDVVTTGTTITEAAKVLKKAGASKIYVLALAKG